MRVSGARELVLRISCIVARTTSARVHAALAAAIRDRTAVHQAMELR